MFYAIEYAYGAHVINNGNRGDMALEFTSKRLRDAWVAAGNPDTNSAGHRAVLSARNPIVRKASGLPDGDREGWMVLAENRASASPALAQHRAILFYDWPEADHYKWVATASEREIINWAKDVDSEWNKVED